MRLKAGQVGEASLKKRPPDPSAQVAQLVEQRIENPRVGSSILSLGTIFQSAAVRGCSYGFKFLNYIKEI